MDGRLGIALTSKLSERARRDVDLAPYDTRDADDRAREFAKRFELSEGPIESRSRVEAVWVDEGAGVDVIGAEMSLRLSEPKESSSARGGIISLISPESSKMGIDGRDGIEAPSTASMRRRIRDGVSIGSMCAMMAKSNVGLARDRWLISYVHLRESEPGPLGPP